jgi:hypothetical protein
MPSTTGTQELPKGVALSSSTLGTYTDAKQYNGEHLLNNIAETVVRNTYISPGFYFNMSTILNYNAIMTNPTEEDLATFKQKGGRESSTMLNAHKNGLALDFILPARPKNIFTHGINYTALPWVYYSLGGTYSIKETILEKFTNMLYNYFDKVLITTSTVSIDMGQIATGTPNNDVRTYAVDIYHVEVDDAIIGKYTTEVSRLLKEY